MCGDICNFFSPFEIYLKNGKSYMWLTCFLHEMKHNLRMNTHELTSQAVLVIYCCVINYFKFCGLKQQVYIISQFLGSGIL